MKKALYAGSFDPITYGHVDIIKRASRLFEVVIVGIAQNSTKEGLFSIQERKDLLEKVVQAEKLNNIEITTFEKLTVQFAKDNGIQVLVRGLRAISDFDQEFQMALTNRNLAADIETVFLMSSQEHFYLSSHLVREVVGLGGDAKQFVPSFVEEALRAKLAH